MQIALFWPARQLTACTATACATCCLGTVDAGSLELGIAGGAANATAVAVDGDADAGEVRVWSFS